MAETTPTPGAINAATEIHRRNCKAHNVVPDPESGAVAYLAEIIDRHSDAPDLLAHNARLSEKVNELEVAFSDVVGERDDATAAVERLEGQVAAKSAWEQSHRELRDAISFAIYWIPRNANEAMRKLCEATGSKPGYTLPLTVLQKENERMRQVILRVVSAWETPDDLTPEEVAHVYEEATAMLASVEPAPKPGFDENGEINCDCGNTPNQSGFDHCDAEGNLMEPVRGSDWQGHYRCADCGKVWKQPGEGGA
jgi:hypothetical protein